MIIIIDTASLSVITGATKAILQMMKIAASSNSSSTAKHILWRQKVSIGSANTPISTEFTTQILLRF
jgi:hypothetical protein